MADNGKTLSTFLIHRQVVLKVMCAWIRKKYTIGMMATGGGMRGCESPCHGGGGGGRGSLAYKMCASHPHTRFTGTAGRVHCVRIFTHFPCYEPACWSLNFMHFQTSVIRLVDRLTWFYRFGITLQINLSPKVCDLSVMFWINIYKLGLKKYPLKSRNFGNLVCLYLGYHGNYTRFICF